MSSAAQRSFASGEFAPSLWPRTDAERYGEGVRTLRNFVVGRAGGAKSRTGFAHLGSTTAGAIGRMPNRVVPWRQSSALPYLMEFGSHSTTLSYLRLWLHGARVTVGSPAAWLTATSYTAGQCVERSGVNYYCFLAHTSGAATTPGSGASWTTVWWPLESNILEIPLPYNSLELFQLQWVDESPTTRLLCHPSYASQELVRVSATEWSIETVVWEDAQSLTAPANPAIADPGEGNSATFTQYKIAALDGDLEGPLSTAVGWNKRPGEFINPAIPSAGNRAPLEVSWDAVSGATGYRVFRSYSSGPYYKVIDVTDTEYRDVGEISQTGLTQEPAASGVEIVSLDAADEYPGVVANVQQRLVVSGRVLTPDEVFASRSGALRDFTFRSPILDDDAIGWRQASTILNRIVHLAEVAGQLVVLSELGEGIATGDTDKILRPGEVNPSQQTFNGAAELPRPLNLNDALLYVQARGSVVRDLRVEQGRITGSDLSALAHHLVDGYTIRDWAYQQTPDPVVWMVRNDGALLSLTYSPAQGVLAWARHDTGTAGTDYVLSVACVPENLEALDFDTSTARARDVLYLLVLRGSTVRLERATDRELEDARGRLHMDAAASTEQATDPLAVAGSSGSYTLTGLSHLEGRAVSLVGFFDSGIDDDARIAVLASPATSLRMVTSGVISLTDAEVNDYYGFAVGLPIICDLETLDIDTVDGRTMKEKGIGISRIGVWVDRARSFFAGPQAPVASTLDGLLKVAVGDDSIASPLSEPWGVTGYYEENLLGRFAKSGRIFLRHVDPTPLTVTAVLPMGKIGG